MTDWTVVGILAPVGDAILAAVVLSVVWAMVVAWFALAARGGGGGQ